MDKDTDHIDFDGDVFIKGNIQDNMVVKATGSVMVLGSIYHSDILALHHIEVDGKMIGGRLQAGQENSIYHIIIPVVENMIENIEGFFEGLHRAKEEDVQKIVEVINDTKEKLDGNIDELEQTSVSMNAAQLEILNTLKADIRKAFLDIKLLRQSGFDKLNEVYAKLHDQLEAMKEEVETVSNITIKYVQGANLNASGDVYITGKGAYQSNVTAGLSILMDNPQSVVKGGTLIAGKRIKAGTVGTPGEIHTLCKVLDREGTVEARFHKGAVVKVRNEEIKITTID
ncbi:MAG TPA: hypothetical protein DHN33_06715 [Eubacteriaceae bacterium]|nr:hypothetical protein [Eubacteriaceae bacterium]